MFRSHRDVPTMPAYLICEACFVARYGLGTVYPGTTDLARFERAGYLTTAPSLAALATKLGIDPAALEATVERYNGFGRTGHDPDFGKGDSELNRFNGDASVKPNPCLGEIRNGPFVAVAVWPAEIGTSTGLVTNRDGEVLNETGAPIAGLYACGNDMASVMEGTYPGTWHDTRTCPYVRLPRRQTRARKAGAVALPLILSSAMSTRRKRCVLRLSASG